MSANHIYNASRVEMSCACGRGVGYCCATCGKVVCGPFCPAFCNRYDDCPGNRPTASNGPPTPADHWVQRVDRDE